MRERLRALRILLSRARRHRGSGRALLLLLLMLRLYLLCVNLRRARLLIGMLWLLLR